MSYQSVQHSIATRQNIELIRKSIRSDQRRVVDIGCNEGLVSMSLARSGFQVLGIEANPGFAQIAEKRSAEPLAHGSFQVVKEPLTFENLTLLKDADSILLLSVHHQFVSNDGLESGNRLLIECFKSAKHQFFFQPACIYAKYDTRMPFVENDFASIERYFIDLFTGIRDFKVRSIGLTDNRLPSREPLRPLMLFEFSEGAESLSLPSDPTQWTDRPTDILQVPVERCRANFWFSFGDDGDHPMQRQVAQLVSNASNLSIEGTVLHQHYQSFQPNTYSEAAHSRGLEGITGPLGSQSCRRYLPIRGSALNESAVWAESLSQAKEIPEWDQNLIGPQADSKIMSEIKRLTQLIQSISKEGYSPDLFDDGFIRGYLVTNKEQWFFMVSAGMHRLAVMAQLGYAYLQVKLQPGTPAILDCSDPRLPQDVRDYLTLFFSEARRS